MKPDPILDLSTIDFSRPVADKEALRAANPQRFEMEQLDAIVFMDAEAHKVVGYKDVRDDEFWVRGHMPGFALFPGVLMCEAAAQMVSYHMVVAGVKQSDYIVFGGMESVRFRGTVRPGDRFVLVGQGIRIDRRQSKFHVQGFVGDTMVFSGDIIGMALNLPKDKKEG
ncbi:MAG: beta-hydroxyacyl-ACP dehydratase [Gemmataceae bacterium]|nr:beta-hydroxyacyl-ACP dehydratase [Gemmataceae bacterium]